MTPDTLIEAARSWLGTPYHHAARLKGVGVDCGQVIIAAHIESGCVPFFDTGFYTSDWHFHRDEEKYLGFIEEHLMPIDIRDLSINQRIKMDPFWMAPPGSVLAFRHGRTFSHGGIVTNWPNMLHASAPAQLVEEVSVLGTEMAKREARVYRYGGLD